MINNLRNTKIRVMSLFLCVMVAMNILLPSQRSYATDYDAGIITGQTLTVQQGGSTVSDGGNIDLSQPFGLSLEVQVPIGAGKILKDDTLTFILNENFRVSGSGVSNQKFYNANGIHVGTINIQDNVDGVAEAKIIFDGEDVVFQEEGNITFTIAGMLSFKGDARNPGVNEVTMYGKTFNLLPDSSVSYTIEKSGEELPSKNIKWTIKVTATQNGVPADLSDFIIRDNIETIGEYRGNFRFNGASTSFQTADYKNYSFKIPAGTTGEAILTFETKPIFTNPANTTETFENIASLHKPDNEKISEGSAQVTVNANPISISKVGDMVIDEHGEKVMQWTIVANENAYSLNNVVITDVLTADTNVFANVPTFKRAYWQKWSSGVFEDTKRAVTPNAASEYEIGNISTKIALTIITDIPALKPGANPNDARLTNSASIRWDGGNVNGSPVDVKVSIAMITERAVSVNGDILTWNAKVRKEGQDITGLTSYNVVSYSGDNVDLSQVQGLPPGFDPSSYAGVNQGLGQRFVGPSGNFDPQVSGGGLIATKYILTKSGVAVGEILEVKGFSGTNDEDYNFQTEFISRRYQASNQYKFRNSGIGYVDNTSTLYAANLRLNSSTAEQRDYSTLVVNKQALRGDSFADIIGNVNSFGYRDNSYNHQENAILYRISVNPLARNLSDRNVERNGNFRKWGDVEFKDYLPAGFEFVPIDNANDFLIFEGGTVDTTDPNYVKLQALNQTTLADAGIVNTPVLNEQLTINLRTYNGMVFKFQNLDKPYVIILKARPTAEYFTKNIHYLQDKTAVNDVFFKSEGNNYEGATYFRAKIDSEFMSKTATDLTALEGKVKWTINYRPSIASLVEKPSITISDKMTAGLEFITDADGNISLENDNIVITELVKGSGGVYTDGSVVHLSATAGGNVIYDRTLKTLSFKINPKKAYRIDYKTKISNGTIVGTEVRNEVSIEGVPSIQPIVSKFVIRNVVITGTVTQESTLKIKKVDSVTNLPLRNAQFTLFKLDGVTPAMPVATTDATGEVVLNVKYLTETSYKLKETNSPSGYRNNTKVYNVTISRVTDANGIEKRVATVDDPNFDITSRTLIVPNVKETPPSGGGGGGGNPPSGGGNPPSGGGNPPSGGGNPPSGGGNPPSGGGNPPTTTPNIPEENIDSNRTPLSGRDKNTGGKDGGTDVSSNGITKITSAPKTGRLANVLLKQALLYGTMFMLVVVSMDEYYRKRK